MKDYTFPKWTELPEIDLYMDQVITYINEKLKDTYFYDEKFITKAMINNLFISRFEDSLNDVFKNNRNTILFENANYEQKLIDNVIQCIIYKMHTEYTLKSYETK